MKSTNAPGWLALGAYLSLCLLADAGRGAPMEDFRAVAWRGQPAPRLGEQRPVVGDPRPCLWFHVPPRRTAEWIRPLSLDLSQADRIAVHLTSEATMSGAVVFTSGEGEFRRGFTIARGEQIVVLRVDSFARRGDAAGLSAVDGLKLSFDGDSRPIAIGLLGINGVAAGEPVSEDQLVLNWPANRVHPQGVAFPMYAIVDGRPETGDGQDLADYLRQMYGRAVPVDPTGVKIAPSLRNVIVLGKQAAMATGTVTEDELAPLGAQGFIIRARGPAITIAGNTRHGVRYGIYRFLEEQGCRFYARGCEIIPAREHPELDDCDLTDQPFFHVKACVGPYSIRGWTTELLGDPRTTDDPPLCDKTLWLDHTAAYLVPRQLYYDDHPDYYALLGNGRRQPKNTPDVRVMLCLSNPGVLEVSAERMLRWIAMQPDRKVFVCAQGDGAEWCQCARCQALGNRADQTLHWVNYVARAVARRFPDKLLMCHAYNGADDPPLRLKPEPNVIVMYAAWPNATSAPNSLRDFDARENIVAKTQLEGWLAVAPHNMGLYDYNGRGRYTLYGMASRVKWCARHDMRAIWYSGTNNSFRDLFSFVHCRLTWDPWEDIRRLKDEFIRAYYGPAAAPVGRLFNLIYDRLDFGDYDGRMRAGGYPPPDFYDSAFVNRVFDLLDEAFALAGDDDRVTADLTRTKELFINNCFLLRPGRSNSLSDDEYRTFARNLREYVVWQWLPRYRRRIAEAEANKQPAPGRDDLVRKVWDLTYVDLRDSPVTDDVPELLREMIRDPKGVVERHRKTYFVERTADGWRIPGLQFEGGQHWRRYDWNCPARENVIVVRGTMTEVSRMTAIVRIVDVPDAGRAILEIEGQDSDKEWCEPVPIEIRINGTVIFEGPNGFAKRGWSRRSWPVPAGVLKRGENRLQIRNLAASDSLTSHWFMLSEARLRLLRD